MNIFKIGLWLIATISSIISLFLLFVALSYFTPIFHRKGHCEAPEKPLIYAHRGNTEFAQENTIEAGISAIKKGYGVELDVDIIKTGEFVLSHDKNVLEIFGVDENISDISIEEYKKFKYLSVVHSKEYPTRIAPPLFKDYINAVCEQYPEAGFIFDIKFDANLKNMNELFDIIDASKCSCNSTNLVAETPYFFNIPNIKLANEGKRCNVKSSLYFYPNTYPISDYLWMKSQFGLWYSMPDIIDIYYTLFDSYPEVFNSMVDNGWCTAVFNHYEKDLDKYIINYYKIIDLSPASHFDIPAAKNALTTTLFVLLLTLIGFGLLIVNVILIKKEFKSKSNISSDRERLALHEENDKPIELESK